MISTTKDFLSQAVTPAYSEARYSAAINSAPVKNLPTPDIWVTLEIDELRKNPNTALSQPAANQVQVAAGWKGEIKPFFNVWDYTAAADQTLIQLYNVTDGAEEFTWNRYLYGTGGWDLDPYPIDIGDTPQTFELRMMVANATSLRFNQTAAGALAGTDDLTAWALQFRRVR